MELKAKKVSGGSSSPEDILKVFFDFNGEAKPADFHSVLHSIELISGTSVTHGGGGEPGVFLSYATDEMIENGGGVADFTYVTMPLKQEGFGTSVIKVVLEYMLQKDYEEHAKEYTKWINSDFEGSEPEQPAKHVLKTGEITLENIEQQYI